MINVQSVVLKMLLTTTHKDLALETFSKLRKDHFNDAFSAIYQSIQNYYNKHKEMPTLDALVLDSSRNARLSQSLTVLKSTEIPDVELAHAIEVLQTEYTQETFLKLLETDVLNDIAYLDQGEILDRVAALHLKLEEKVNVSGKVFNANEIRLFSKEEDVQLNFIALGISNELDALLKGLARGETLLIGGWRGTGKSIICSNAQVNQYNNGDIAPYFTIEMNETEVFRRNLAIMSGVSALAIRNNSVQGADLLKLARARAGMFHGGGDLLAQYIRKYTLDKMGDYYDLESELMKNYELHTPMIIIHDPELSTATIDVEMNKLVTKYGDRVTMTILDYINQTRLPNTSMLDAYDWKQQMLVSSTFKGINQKYNTAGLAPFQIDKDGKARLSQGILDSCDMAANLNAAKSPSGFGGIMLNFVKARSSDAGIFIPEIDWTSLKLDGTSNLSLADLEKANAEFVIPIDTPKKTKKSSGKQSGEEAADI
ncbi:putative DNA helicase [Pectobacterium phage DU_PP_V]|uniref:Putative DNA helicase n=1 Tax=Pectobacterium phage DU_PP_V TaxID=2041492 RepID=A0A2D2W707_9CAUD|nr:putative DNA helicase [Pectobacterium phage DU_PP_V]ATS94078.1 putative DNA helicase [Pectobacterium phage DU_PP_V]